MTRNSVSRRWPAATRCSGSGRPEFWAKVAPDAEAYAKEVVLADFESGDKDVAHKIIKDLEPKGITEQQIRLQMTELLTQAVAQIKKSG